MVSIPISTFYLKPWQNSFAFYIPIESKMINIIVVSTQKGLHIIKYNQTTLEVKDRTGVFVIMMNELLPWGRVLLNLPHQKKQGLILTD